MRVIVRVPLVEAHLHVAGQRRTSEVGHLAGEDGGEPAAGHVLLVGGAGERIVEDGEVGGSYVELVVDASDAEPVPECCGRDRALGRVGGHGGPGRQVDEAIARPRQASELAAVAGWASTPAVAVAGPTPELLVWPDGGPTASPVLC